MHDVPTYFWVLHSCYSLDYFEPFDTALASDTHSNIKASISYHPHIDNMYVYVSYKNNILANAYSYSYIGW